MTITIPVSIPTSDTGAALEAALVDSAGAVQGGWPVITGFALDGTTGTWTGVIPDAWRGAIRVRRQSDHVTRYTYALDPQETGGGVALSSADELVFEDLRDMIYSPGGAARFTSAALQDVWEVASAAHTAAGTFGGLINSESGSGTGDVVVDHNYGGADALRVMQGAAPVDNATIRAYVAALYDAGTYSVVAQQFTGSDGRWVGPMNLDAETYKIVVSKPGVIVDKIVALTVT